MQIAVLSITTGGKQLAEKIADGLPGAQFLYSREGVAQSLCCNWRKFDAFICVMATGIVVRSIASLLKDKQGDPAVVVCDERGQFAISLLSGHLGGANALAHEVARLTGGTAVITTASDVCGQTALDLWAREHGLIAADRKKMTTMAARLINRGKIFLFFDEVSLAKLPADFQCVEQKEDADVVVTYRDAAEQGVLVLHPINVVAGVGCNRGTASVDIERALQEACETHGVARQSVRNLASIDLKADEEGLLVFARENGYSIDFFSKDELNRVENVSSSKAVIKATGAQGVAEPAALLSAGSTKLIVRKMKWKDVTIALAVAEFPWLEQGREVEII